MDAGLDASHELELARSIAALRSGDVTVRSDAAHALGKLTDERGVPALAAALQDPDEYVRKSAVMALRRIGGPAATEALRDAISDRSEQVALQAAKAAGELRDKGAVEPLIRVLSRRERSLQNAAMDALIRVGGDAIPGLMEAFKDRTQRRRIGNQVLRVLTEIGARGTDALIESLADEAYYVRLSAASVLGRVGDRRVVVPLVQLFLSDARLQDVIVSTLARLEDRGVLSHPEGTADRDLALPAELVAAFQELPREQVLESLAAALENPSGKVRKFAYRARFALEGDKSHDALLRALEDEDLEVKRLAIRLLGKLRDKHVIEPLLQMLMKNGGGVEDAIWNTIKVLTDLREYESLRARVAKDKAGGQPVVRRLRKERDVSPDWWREQD